MILIDANNLCYAAYYKTAYLRYGLKKTGIIFGFLTQLHNIARKFKDVRPIVFAWDSRKNVRKIDKKTYKASRKSPLTKEDYAQFKILRMKVLPELGFKNNFMSTGLEADDVIASICLLYPGTKIIVSTDNDLYQLLTDEVSIYKSQSKKEYTKKQFIKEYGIEPELWVMVKAIAGCKTDEIAAVAPGIGEKRAIAFIRKELTNPKQMKAIRDASSVFEENLKLVSLPFNCTPIPYPVDFDVAHSLKGFYSICESYGFRSIQNAAEDWIETFQLR